MIRRTVGSHAPPRRFARTCDNSTHRSTRRPKSGSSAAPATSLVSGRRSGGRRLVEFLATRNVLPKYGFPVDVVELNLARTGDNDALKLSLSRDLALAIGEYAPGSETVAAKALWASRGLVIREGESWPTYGWAVCDICGAFRHRLGEVDASVASVGARRTSHGKPGPSSSPFSDSQANAARLGQERRGLPGGLARIVLRLIRRLEPELQTLEAVGGGRHRFRYSRQGRIIVINRGPVGAGYRVCERCGFGEPITGRDPEHARASRHPLSGPQVQRHASPLSSATSSLRTCWNSVSQSR